MMVRVLILIILVWLLYLILRQFMRNDTTKKSTAETTPNFVQCSQCGCHTPEIEAQVHHGLTTCNSTECIKRAQTK